MRSPRLKRHMDLRRTGVEVRGVATRSGGIRCRGMDGRFRGFEVATTPDGIATITMNEPEHLNGTTQPMKRDMTEVFTQLQMDDSVRVVVVTGTGRAFCAGDDMTGRRRAWDDVDKLVPTLPPGHQDP